MSRRDLLVVALVAASRAPVYGAGGGGGGGGARGGGGGGFGGGGGGYGGGMGGAGGMGGGGGVGGGISGGGSGSGSGSSGGGSSTGNGAGGVGGGIGGAGGAGGGMGGFNGGPQGPSPLNLSGNVEITGKGGLKMKTAAGWVLVQIARATKVQFTGKATRDFLKTGVPVEFTAEVDEKHVVNDAVTQLTIVSLSADRGPGLFAEGSSETKPAAANNLGFGGAPAPNAAADKTASRAAPRKAEAVKLPATCVVRGKITSFKDGKFIVSTGHGTITGEVDEEAEINVATTDLKFARKGDSVSVKGRNAGNTVLADSVTVQASETLTGKKKPKAHSPAKKDKAPAGDDKGA